MNKRRDYRMVNVISSVQPLNYSFTANRIGDVKQVLLTVMQICQKTRVSEPRKLKNGPCEPFKGGVAQFSAQHISSGIGQKEK